MSDLQTETLRLFLALRLHRPAWAGALLLCVGLDEPGRALALASLAAGAAGIFVEPDPALLRFAQREGCCTFTVTSLSEAIRILKNEVRQGRAITVALRCPVAEVLVDALRRGLQPQALTFSRMPGVAELPPAEVLHRRGADLLAGRGLVGGPHALDLPAELPDGWVCETDHALTHAERVSRDAEWIAAAAGTQTDGDTLALLAAQWLQVAPSLFPRALSRAVLSRRS